MYSLLSPVKFVYEISLNCILPYQAELMALISRKYVFSKVAVYVFLLI